MSKVLLNALTVHVDFQVTGKACLPGVSFCLQSEPVVGTGSEMPVSLDNESRECPF
jgi:hypothetical protein